MNTNNAVGERFRLARERMGLSQNDVAAELRCTRQTISAWEHGVALPKSRRMARVCGLYGCTHQELVIGPLLPLPTTPIVGTSILQRIFERVGAADPYRVRLPMFRLT